MASKYDAQNRYAAKNRTCVNVAFMKSTEQDLIDYLSTIGNKAGYIKKLIREDMKKNK